MQTLSRAEVEFVTQGISQDIRQDGRARLEYRHITAERSVLPLAHGSARVSLANGETEVLASVKLELGVPAQATPDRGHIEVSVDYPTRFFARSPSKLRLDDVAELTRMLQR
jgi:exosome complex component RRP42